MAPRGPAPTPIALRANAHASSGPTRYARPMSGVTIEWTGRATQRDRALDGLRGLIVVLMALDHANLFITEAHSPGEHWFRMPQFGSAVPFLTRLVTHPAAPGFFFLMGIGLVMFAGTRRERGWSEARIIRHFLGRGTGLIVLQFTIVNLAWQSGPGTEPTLYLGVLAALGGGMLLGGLVLRLPAWALATASAAMFVVTELTHPDAADWEQLFSQPLGLVFGYSGGTDFFWSNYPILPWLELVLLGMAFGKWLRRDRDRAYRWALWIGATFLIGFAILRTGDGFGNVVARQEGWIGFFNVTKYPPAMTFTLLTMGFNFVALAALARIGDRRRLEPLTVFGSVPLFFYLTHLYLYSALGRLEPGTGSYPTMYLLCLTGLAILYPVCLWYRRLKRRYPDSLLRFV